MILLIQPFRKLHLQTLKLSSIPISLDWASKSFTQGLDCDLSYRIGITTKVTNFCHDLFTHSERSVTCWSVATRITTDITTGILRLLQPVYFYIKGSTPSQNPLAQWASKAYACLSSPPLGRCSSTYTSFNAVSCIIADCFFVLLPKVFISSLWLSVAPTHLTLTIIWPPPNWAMLGFTCSWSYRGSQALKNGSFYEPVISRWHQLMTQAE